MELLRKTKDSNVKTIEEEKNSKVIFSTPSMLEAVYYDKKLRDAFETFLQTEYNLEPW